MTEYDSVGVVSCMGASINYIDKQGEGAKCQQYYISLCSKFVNEGGGGVKNPQNFVNVVYGCPLMGKMEHEKRTNPLTKFHGENFLTEKRNVWLFFDV